MKPRPHWRCLATGRSFAVVDLLNCLCTSLLSSSKRWRWQWTRCFWHGAISGGESSNSAQTFVQKYYKTTHTTRYCSVASAISLLAIIHHGKPTFTLNLVHNPDNQMPWSSSLFSLKLGPLLTSESACVLIIVESLFFGFHVFCCTSFFPLCILIFPCLFSSFPFLFYVLSSGLLIAYLRGNMAANCFCLWFIFRSWPTKYRPVEAVNKSIFDRVS